MFNNIIFIGGIHGVGKSTICQHICSKLPMEYLSASELLKWKEINDDSKNKKVENISDKQDRLIIGLENTIQKDKFYLLDGHYCLLNSNNKISKVPLETFKQINSISFNLVLGNISEIKQRLEARDNRPYDYELLQHFQDEELAYAKYLSKKFNVSLNIGKNNDYLNILESLRKTIKKTN